MNPKQPLTIDNVIDNYLKSTPSRKIFCIGRNKTGTTSLKIALQMLGFKIGHEQIAALFLDDWAKRDFQRLIEYCQTADAFQDIPFSLSYTYQALDQAFPNAKFILTIRNNGEDWYQSMIRYMSQRHGKGKLPTVADLQQDSYIYQGSIWRNEQLIYGIGVTVDQSLLFDRQYYINHYYKHNQDIVDYFRYRPNDLLILNLADQNNNMKKLCDFLGVEYQGQAMPHLNKSHIK